MALNVKITDQAMRDRLAAQLERNRVQIGEMADNLSGPRSRKSPHLAALVRSARADARDLARFIRDWDKAARADAQREAGKRRGKRRGAAKGEGGDSVAKRGTGGKPTAVRGD